MNKSKNNICRKFGSKCELSFFFKNIVKKIIISRKNYNKRVIESKKTKINFDFLHVKKNYSKRYSLNELFNLNSKNQSNY